MTLGGLLPVLASSTKTFFGCCSFFHPFLQSPDKARLASFTHDSTLFDSFHCIQSITLRSAHPPRSILCLSSLFHSIPAHPSFHSSFNHSFSHSLTHLLTHSLTHLFLPSSLPSIVHSLVHRFSIRPSIRPPIHPSIHLNHSIPCVRS